MPTPPTTPNPTPEKKVVKVEILHLDEKGYGPQGKHTRREWRKECLDNLLAGKEQFEAWQASWKDQIDINLLKVSLAATLHYDDGTQRTVQGGDLLPLQPYTFDFVAQTFETDVNAIDITFEQVANFREATFTGNADFSEATFTGSANFSEARFTWIADFSEAKFTWIAVFSKATFTGDADFSSSTFKGNITFQSSRFEKLSKFENAVFNKVGHFEGARFTTAPPGFRGCEIEKTRLEFSDDNFFPQSYAKDADLNTAHLDISFLKRLSDQHGQTDQALNFNAMELKVKKLLPDSGWGFKVMTWLYEVISDYGRSFTRPLGIYAFLLFLTFMFALEHSAYNAPRTYGNTDLITKLVHKSVTQALNLDETIEPPNQLCKHGIRQQRTPHTAREIPQSNASHSPVE